ncbi:hypothetical protein DL96DRAFT_1715110 [Flagelloscypha sp. PMI_526]|nr:hypothetical protein DL96DRAFT_1715110 [Flagelloscypha sp. PMI_526]
MDPAVVCRATGGRVPSKRKGASMTVAGDQLYLFGGLLPDNKTVVSDLFVLDLNTFQWFEIPTLQDGTVPAPRYFHTANIWNDNLVIFGGRTLRQTDNSPYAFDLNDIHIFHIPSQMWVQTANLLPPSPGPFSPQARYAPVSAISGDLLYIFGGQDIHDQWFDDILVCDLTTKRWIDKRVVSVHVGRYRSVAMSSTLEVVDPGKSSNVQGDPTLHHMSFSQRRTNEEPPGVYLFNNFNGVDIQLHTNLHLFETDRGQKDGRTFHIFDRTRRMSGQRPPCLRFPTGHMVGAHLLLSGVAVNGPHYVFSMSSLNLSSMEWTRLPCDEALRDGSWHGSVVFARDNKLIVLGDRSSSMDEDYTSRAMSFDDAMLFDLESYGVYQPPEQDLESSLQELGLATLGGQHFADFQLICGDGTEISCSRTVLEQSWPWMKDRLDVLKGRPEGAAGNSRLTTSSFRLGENRDTTRALLEYFYTRSLVTPLQHSPEVRGRLLSVATSYGIPHLRDLIKHALHLALTPETAEEIARVAASAGCQSLQERARRMASQWTHYPQTVHSSMPIASNSRPITPSEPRTMGFIERSLKDRPNRASSVNSLGGSSQYSRSSQGSSQYSHSSQGSSQYSYSSQESRSRMSGVPSELTTLSEMQSSSSLKSSSSSSQVSLSAPIPPPPEQKPPPLPAYTQSETEPNKPALAPPKPSWLQRAGRSRSSLDTVHSAGSSETQATVKSKPGGSKESFKADEKKAAKAEARKKKKAKEEARLAKLAKLTGGKGSGSAMYAGIIV